MLACPNCPVSSNPDQFSLIVTKQTRCNCDINGVLLGKVKDIYNDKEFICNIFGEHAIFAARKE